MTTRANNNYILIVSVLLRYSSLVFISGLIVLLSVSEHIWPVQVKNKGLGGNSLAPGQYRLCLTNKSLSFIKINNTEPDIGFQVNGLLIYTFVCLFVHSFIYSFVRSFIQSFNNMEPNIGFQVYVAFLKGPLFLSNDSICIK